MPIEALLITCTAWGLCAGAIWETFDACRNLGLPIDRGMQKVLTATLVLLAWLFFTGLIGAFGKISDFKAVPPPFLLFMGLSFLLTFFLAFSSLGSVWAKGLGLPVLIGFQAFRIVAELSLYFGYKHGVFPVQMTFEGWNYDIVTGVTALPVALLLLRYPSRKLALTWNWMGLVLLIAIITLAVTSTPTPLRLFFNEPPNTIVTTFPYIWLPTVLVPFALLGHLLCFRALAK